LLLRSADSMYSQLMATHYLISVPLCSPETKGTAGT
jgi:hypothetical protein